MLAKMRHGPLSSRILALPDGRRRTTDLRAVGNAIFLALVTPGETYRAARSQVQSGHADLHEVAGVDAM